MLQLHKKDIGVLFIGYRTVRRLRRIGIPAKYCSHIDGLKNLIRKNKQYKMIVICKAKHIPILYNILTERNIYEIYTLGHCTVPRIPNKEVTTINTNEQDLIFHTVTETIRYTRREQLTQEELGNRGLANALAQDLLKLIDLTETL
jgi:hypothetical protein